MTLTLWFSVLLALAAVPTWATPTIEQEQAIRTTFVTPHTPWAKPYAGGTTRVLFFSDYRNTQAREIVELMQRFDIQADAAYWSRIVDTTHSQWHGGEEGIARIRRLIESGAHDVFLFNGTTLDKLPTDLQDKLRQQVAEGKGLVLVGVDDKRLLKQPIERHPEQGDPEADLFTVNQGRAARLPGAPVSEYTFGWDVPYDHWQERLGRTVLWAAGTLPGTPLTLRRLETQVEVSGVPLPTSMLAFTLPAGAGIAQVRIRERRDDGMAVREAVLKILPLASPPPWTGEGQGGGERGCRTPIPTFDPGETNACFSSTGATENHQPGPVTRRGSRPAYTGLAAIGLPAGHYHDDVIAMDAAGRVVTWATLPFTVTSPRTLSLDLPKAWSEVGEAISGTVKLTGQPLESERIAVELRDRRGRILARTEPAAPHDNAVPFAFPIPAWYPMLVQVRAVVQDRTGEAADAVAYFNVTKRHRGRFNLLSWDIPMGPTAAWAHEALARLGVTLELGRNPEPPRVMAAYDMAYVPYTTRILAEKDDRGWMTPMPWNQVPEIDRYAHDLAAKYEPARRHGVFAYSLGDETVTRGSDLSPSDLAAYRDYLQGVYGTIAALNESWGTEYSRFEEIMLLDPHDPKESQAKRDGHYTRWYDRQAWESANFLRLCQRFDEAYRKLDPQARTGFEGAGRLQKGDDIDGIVRTNGFWTPYPGPVDQVLRGIAPRDFLRANWMGYAKDADSLIWSYWRMVLNGSDAVWWWRWDNIGRFMGLLRPDLSPFDEVAELLEDTRIMREGLGDLLLQSEMQTDGITLLYSHPSMYAAQVAEGPSYGAAAAAHEAWHQALFNLGLSFNYSVSPYLWIRILVLC
jgi:hypothetical protein